MYDFSDNKVTASTGVQMYDNCLGSESNCGMQSSELVLINSAFETTDGVLIDASFSDRTTALVLGNDFSEVASLGVRLGTGTSHCVVVLTTSTTVENLGTTTP